MAVRHQLAPTMNPDRSLQKMFLRGLGVLLVGCLWFTHIMLRQAHGLEPSRGVGLLADWAFAFLVVLWVRSDYRRSRYWPCFEYDMFLFVAWPLLLPHYLVRTRGPRGLLILAGMFALLLAAAVLVAVIMTVVGVVHQ